MNILFVLDSLGTGGTERQMELMIEHWPAGDRIEICSLSAGGDASARFSALAPVHVVPRRGRMDLRQCGPLRRIVSDRGIDLVFAAHRYAGLVAKLARVLGMPVPVVCSVRGRHTYSRAQRLVYDVVDLWLMGRAAAVVTNSRRVAQDLLARRSFRGALEIIPNGIDPSLFVPADRTAARRALGLADDAEVVLCVGRLVEIKDPLRAVEVTAEVADRGRDVHLLWVGDGPLRTRAEAAAREHGVTERVHLIGARDDVRPSYAAADLLLHTSQWENLSNTILEAMAHGLAVVARPVGGNAELVADGVNGRLGDDLARHVLELLEDADLRHRLGEAGAARARAEFSVESAVRRHREVFARALGAAEGSPS